jgi:Skp family chaperone for outer membrane proteins
MFLVLEAGKAGVIYFQESMDITDEVVSRFDAAN